MMTNDTGFSAGMDAAFEAAEAAARIAAEKEEADRKERLATEEKARLMTARGRYPIRHAIVQAAIALGSTATTTEDANELFVDGIGCSWWLQFVEERTSTSSWRSRPNGKMRITVGDFGNRTSYPQKKDGTHNYEAIAATLRGYAQRKLAERQAETNRRRNVNDVALIKKEFNLPDYQQVVLPSPHAVGKVVIDFKQINSITASPEHACKVLQALRDLGVKLSYNDK